MSPETSTPSSPGSSTPASSTPVSRPPMSRPPSSRPSSPRPFFKKKPYGKRKDDKKKKPKKFRKKVCKLCIDRQPLMDYKEVSRLQRFITEKGKMLPRRISGNCARHQRQVASAIKRARQVALLPYTVL